MVAVRCYSKSFESIEENSKSIEIIIKELRNLFSRFVMSNKILFDNTPFYLLKFEEICFEVGFPFM